MGYGQRFAGSGLGWRLGIPAAVAIVAVVIAGGGGPQVEAGSPAVVLATTTHTLAANCHDDGQPDPPAALACAWSQTVGTGCTFEAGADSFTCSSGASPDFDVTCDESEAATLRLCCDDDGAGENVAVCDTVVITAHTAPVANAGADDDASIAVAYTLDGACTDDGLPNAARTCGWAQTTGAGCVFETGAASFSCTGAGDADFDVTCSQAESAVLTLTCSDGAVSDDDTVTLTISAAPAPPTVNAGSDVASAAPLSTGTAHTFAATCADDGQPAVPGVLTCGWTVSAGCTLETGADLFECDSTDDPDFDVTCSTTGSQTATLCCDDESDTPASGVCDAMTIASNTAPSSVNAGADASAETDVAEAISCSASDDGLPSPPAAISYVWTKTSGPGSCTFGNANAASTTATCNAAGSVVLTCTASDSVRTTPDTVTLTVHGPNDPPDVAAGSDVPASAPQSSGSAYTLAASCSDDGEPDPPGELTCGWTVGAGCTLESGADDFTCIDNSSPDFDVTCTTTGAKTLTLFCDDESDVPADGVSDAMTLYSNTAPSSVNAGADANADEDVAESISCSASDDGLPSPPAAISYSWAKQSGPGNCTFGNSALASTTATCDTGGTVTLRCTASDSVRTATDDVVLTVASAITAQEDVRWLFSAASSGTSPNFADDSVGDSDITMAAAIAENAGNNHWSSDAQGNGFVFGNPDATSDIADVDNKDISWASLTQWTLELTVTMTSGSGQDIILFLQRGFGGRAGGVQRVSGALRFYHSENGYDEYTDFMTGAGRGTLFVVHDSPEASEANRLRVYWNGSLQTPSGGSGTHAQNSTIDCPSDCELWVAGHMSGTVWGGAWYSEEVSPADISAIGTALAANHDADPTP